MNWPTSPAAFQGCSRIHVAHPARLSAHESRGQRQSKCPETGPENKEILPRRQRFEFAHPREGTVRLDTGNLRYAKRCGPRPTASGQIVPPLTLRLFVTSNKFPAVSDRGTGVLANIPVLRSLSGSMSALRVALPPAGRQRPDRRDGLPWAHLLAADGSFLIGIHHALPKPWPI